MKRWLLTCFLSYFYFAGLFAQTYGNEWVNYSQRYYKIKIVKEGIYRIDSLTLAIAGIPVSSIDARSFQIFNKGKEQAIYVYGESDGVLNTKDYIEFYANKNDGELDTALYVNTPYLPNPYYSLVNDTATYFLTWNGFLSNKRILQEQDTSFSTYPVASYFLKTETVEQHLAYYYGETDQVGGTDSRYVRSETWGGAAFGLGASDALAIPVSNRFLSGPDATFTTMVVGASKDANLINSNTPDHRISISMTSLNLIDTLFFGYDAIHVTKRIPVTGLVDGKNNVTYSSITNPLFSSNRTFVTYATLTYPHTFTLENKGAYIMLIPDGGAVKSTLNFLNYNVSSNAVLYDLTNSKRISVVKSGAEHKAVISNTGADKNCLLISEDSIRSIQQLVPVTPSGRFTDYLSLSTDSAYLIITHKKLLSSVVQYKDYRTNHQFGGHHHAVLADIDELYDQFAYGISKSPLAIKNYCRFLLAYYPSPPQNLFLIGKAVDLQSVRQNQTFSYKFLVPSFGFPSSDNLLTAGLLPSDPLVPAIPTGRLAAQSNEDVTIYLNKVMQFEDKVNNPPEEWMKHVLHFGGGSSAAEQGLLKGYLDQYKFFIQDTLFGGIVNSFFKTSTSPIQINTSEFLKKRINDGVALMTFFGHAYGSGFDQNIDDVNAYNPLPGHYPLLLANSCYSGDIHTVGALTSSETFVLAKNKGTIGYLGAVSLGVPYALNVFSNNFYSELSSKNYGKNLGKIIQHTIKNIQPMGLSDNLVRQVCYDMAYHGDPAVGLPYQEKPDYTIKNNGVFFDLQSSIDSFTVYVELTNLGKAVNDSIVTELTRVLPGGETQRYEKVHRASKFKDTIAFKLWKDFSKGAGLNKFNIITDAYNTIDENNEQNNTINGVTILINGGSINPVYPYDFAIVSKDTLTLKASTVDPLALATTYVFQIDTTDTYNSPFTLTYRIKSSGGVLAWHPPINLIHSKVYYWRVSSDSVSALNGYNWKESSFQYIPGKQGWEQAHFYQFKNNKTQYVKFNRLNKRFDFANDLKTISVYTTIPTYEDFMNVGWAINGSIKTYWSCMNYNSGFAFAVIDPVTGQNLQTTVVSPTCNSCPNGQYGNTQCRDYPYDSFEFMDNNASRRSNITNFLTNVVPNGYYVLGYSLNKMKLPYENDLLKSFELIGAKAIQTTPVNVPYIVFGRKGMAAGTAREIAGTSVNDFIRLDTAITTMWKDGFIASPVIGPATRWDSLSWSQHTLDTPVTYDSITVKLTGIQADGKEVQLASFDKSTTNVANLFNYVDAKVYPTIRLTAYLKDDSLHTPAQLDKWQVFYEPVPEMAINPLAGYRMQDTVSAGETNVMLLPIQNIGEQLFTDSVLIHYWLEDNNRIIHQLPLRLKKNMFKPNEIIIDTLLLNTASLSGSNAIWTEVNPVNMPHSQIEQYHFNNISKSNFYVKEDYINPLLDVTFDGVHILNNELISARPHILIQLKDENKFLALNDTNDFKIYLKIPSNPLSKRIYFGNEMNFIPAVLPNNSCRIDYRPYLIEDGTYQLIVQAKDRSRNESGQTDYTINFTVQNESTITQVMNYPNPFSTATHFVFTLTGSEVPTRFKIQIMTISGKIVREIFEDEIGPLHIGKNITKYAWDGKDQFGDPLGNGVYLYRVITKINGENIKRKETSADIYFKNGWGKMYLMR